MSFTDWKEGPPKTENWVQRMTLSPWNDKRQSIRVEGRIEVLGDLGTRKMLGTILDLSWTGFRLETQQPIPAGTLLRISSPKLGESLKVWCICRWSCPSPLSSAGQAFWSGHEMQSGPLSPRRDWVKKSLLDLGVEEDLLSNRRRTQRFTTHVPALVEGMDGQLVSISLFGGCLILDKPLSNQPVHVFLAMGRRGLQLECLRRSTRLLADGTLAHHLSWEHKSPQVRAVAILLRAHGESL